jgi:hypothetical protein
MLVKDLYNNCISSVDIVVCGWFDENRNFGRSGFHKEISEGCNEKLLDKEVHRFSIHLDPHTMQLYLAVYVKGEL